MVTVTTTTTTTHICKEPVPVLVPVVPVPINNNNNRTTCSQPPHNYARFSAFLKIASVLRCDCCDCYRADSTDARCCGACYCCCPVSKPSEQCNWIPNTFTEYLKSGYFTTIDSSTKVSNNDEKCFCTLFCLPLKIIFFPCCIGSAINSSINYCRKTNLNYFC